MPGTRPKGRRELPAATVLFLSMFAAQTTAFVLAPMLPRLAAEFAVPVAAVGQLRTISGLVAGLTTSVLAAVARRLPLRDLIATGLGLLALGALAAALSVDFVMLAASHVVIGMGMGIVLAGGSAAAGQWTPTDGRTRLLSWTLTGPPIAAIVATLVGGVLADVSWRMAWVAVPFAASVFAVAAIGTRPQEPPIPQTSGHLRSLWRVPGVPGWAAGELLAYSAWSGIPVYAGALLIRSYGVSPTIAAGTIRTSAVAFLAGSLSARRWVDGAARSLLLVSSLMLAAVAAAFGMLRPGLWLSVTLLVVLGGLAGGRTLAGSVFGSRAVPHRGVAVMGVRTTAQQCGYVFGAGVGGAAIAAGGYAALGALLSALFLLAALPHGLAVRRGTAARPAKLRHGLGAVPDVTPTAPRSASLP